jgi:hypothetical protein
MARSVQAIIESRLVLSDEKPAAYSAAKEFYGSCGVDGMAFAGIPPSERPQKPIP